MWVRHPYNVDENSDLKLFQCGAKCVPTAFHVAKVDNLFSSIDRWVRFPIFCATLSSFTYERDTRSKLIPRRANSNAMAFPIPSVGPVITAHSPYARTLFPIITHGYYGTQKYDYSQKGNRQHCCNKYGDAQNRRVTHSRTRPLRRNQLLTRIFARRYQTEPRPAAPRSRR